MFVWIGKDHYVNLSDIRRIKKYKSHNGRFVLQAVFCDGSDFLGNVRNTVCESVFDDESMCDAAFHRLAELIEENQKV